MIGHPLPRVEDARFLTGQGRYLADITPDGTKHIAILRSPVAHAEILSIDVDPARSLDGVQLVVTGADLAATSRPFSHRLALPGIQPLEWPVLAVDRVRFVGEPVAAVVADSRYVAEDALEVIDVAYELLDVVVDPEAALGDGAPLLYPEWGTNEFLHVEGDFGDVAQAFDAADAVLRERFTHHRVIGLPLEGRGATGSYDPTSGRLLVYASNQQPHQLRTVISDITGLSEAKTRVIAPDMGGGFGNKQHFYREEALVALLAMRVPHPVQWAEDRAEALTASVHSREQIHDVEVAYRSDGRILALKADITANVGNPVLYFTGAAPALVTAGYLTGTYDIPNYAYTLRCAATNTCPNGAYRGFGQPQAHFTIERVLDLLAVELDLDPSEIRRRNLIPDEPRPFVTSSGSRYDVGSFRDQFDDLLQAVGYEECRAEQARARNEGRFVGVGLSSLVDASAPNQYGVAGRFGAFEMAMLVVQPDGHVNVVAGTKSQGQGHETFLAQIVSDVLGVPIEHVDVRQGDTALLPYGMGTWGSRSAVMGGGAVLKAAEQVADKIRLIASHLLDVGPDQISLAGGRCRAADRDIELTEVTGAAYLHPWKLPPGTDVGLVAVVGYDPGRTTYFPDDKGRMNFNQTYTTAASAAVVDVDVDTGKVRVLDFVMVHDSGRVGNPRIVDGQIQGGLAQGVGAILLEEMLYNHDGQPLTSTLLDYRLPAFEDVPPARIRHRETPSTLLGGFRGVGETGIIAAPAAIANAVDDALRPLGVKVRQTNLGPHHVRGLLRAAGHTVHPLRHPDTATRQHLPGTGAQPAQPDMGKQPEPHLHSPG